MFTVALSRSTAMTVALAVAAGSLAVTSVHAAPEGKPAYMSGGDYMPPVFSGPKTPRRVGVRNQAPQVRATRARVVQAAVRAPIARPAAVTQNDAAAPAVIPAADVRPATTGTMALEAQSLNAKALNAKPLNAETVGELQPTAATAPTVPAADDKRSETASTPPAADASTEATAEPRRLLVDEKPINKARLADGTTPSGEICSRFDATAGKPIMVLCR